jgi:hypothetical protein
VRALSISATRRPCARQRLCTAGTSVRRMFIRHRAPLIGFQNSLAILLTCDACSERSRRRVGAHEGACLSPLPSHTYSSRVAVTPWRSGTSSDELERPQTALAVLIACTEHCHPEPADVELLKKHALPHEADLPIDELACEIIQRELGTRKAAAATAD